MTSDKDRELDVNCPIIDTNLCRWLHDKTGCKSCYIGSIKDDSKKEEASASWETTLSLVPNNIDDLHESQECQLCKGDIKKADGYAFFEMANPEPRFEKGMFFGIGKKMRSPVGSLLTLQMSTCNHCKKAFRKLDLIQALGLIIGVGGGIATLLVPAIATPMAQMFVLLPILFVLITGIAGYFLGKYFATKYLKKMSATVKFDLVEIPLITKMIERNWFFFQVVQGLPRVSFSKKKQYDSLVKKSEGLVDIDEDIPLDNINI